MTPTEMEEALNNCDRRLSAIEQILPTLATKDDLQRYATKEDLTRMAADLRGEIAESRHRADLQHDSVRDDIRIVAENVARLSVRFDELTAGVEKVELATERMEMKTDVLETRTGRVETKLDVLIDRLEKKGVI